MNDLFRVGVFASTHGIKGEINVYPTTDELDRFDYIKDVLMDCGKDGMKELEVEGVKYFKNMPILKFKGIDNINDIEKYKGADIFVTRENAIPLEEGEFYVSDIIGLDVFTDEGNKLGVLKDVIQTGANDVFDVTMENGKSVLLPKIDECILKIDLEEKKITVHMMKGLL